MKNIWREESRARLVHESVKAWWKQRWLDDAGVILAGSRVPPPLPRPSLFWQILLFAGACFAVGSGIGIVFLAVEMVGLHDQTVLRGMTLILGIGLAIAADLLRRTRFGMGGIAAAAVTMALLALGGFWATLVLDESMTLFCLGMAVLSFAAAWHHGFPFFAVPGAIFLIWACGDLSGKLAGDYTERLLMVRLGWILISVFLVWTGSHLARSPHLPPPHRKGGAATLGVGLIAIYLAFNAYVWEDGLETFLRRGPEALFWLAVAATAALPLLYLGVGLCTRSRTWLDTGILTAVASLLTLRYYVHLMPAWLALSLGGALLAGAAFLVERRLHAAPGGELGGFSADEPPTGEEGQKLADLVVATAAGRLAASTAHPSPQPAAHAASPAPPSPPVGEGGRFDGGGSEGGF